jgi:preprotein translocase SecE subunit
MAKTRAQRKAEARRREAERARKGQTAADEAQAQHDTQVPESADVIEAELAEQGADLDALRGSPEDDAVTEAPAPSRADVGRPEDAEGAEPADKISRRARRAEERERKQRAKESERRRAPKDAPVERQRGGVAGFIASCWAELKRVQWPDRETLIQASAVTILFVAVMALYLGVLDFIFSELVDLFIG